jgi:hypothetical protein
LNFVESSWKSEEIKRKEGGGSYIRGRIKFVDLNTCQIKENGAFGMPAVEKE